MIVRAVEENSVQNFDIAFGYVLLGKTTLYGRSSEIFFELAESFVVRVPFGSSRLRKTTWLRKLANNR